MSLFGKGVGRRTNPHTKGLTGGPFLCYIYICISGLVFRSRKQRTNEDMTCQVPLAPWHLCDGHIRASIRLTDQPSETIMRRSVLPRLRKGILPEIYYASGNMATGEKEILMEDLKASTVSVLSCCAADTIETSRDWGGTGGVLQTCEVVHVCFSG